VRATAPPHRRPGIAGYERAQARRERRRLAVAALAVALGLLVLALFFLWEWRKAAGVTYSHWGPLGSAAGNDYDEGAYIISAQLLLKGSPLFHSVFSAQPAFFLPSLAAVVRAIGNPVVAGHVYEALFGLATLVGVFWMAWTAYHPLAGPLAAALLAISPGFLLYAHAVEAEMPMLGLCTLSVAAAQAYYLTRRRSMAALCGLLLMAGTEMKLLSVVVTLPLALLLLGGAWRGSRPVPAPGASPARGGGGTVLSQRREAMGLRRAPRAITLDALAFVLCLVAPALLALALLSPADQLRQVVALHLAASRVLPLDAGANLQALKVFLGYDPGLLLVAVAGAVMALLWGRNRYLVLVYALWFLSTLIFLWRYHPFLQHQFVPLLPPLALLGAALAAPVGSRQYAVGRNGRIHDGRTTGDGLQGSRAVRPPAALRRLLPTAYRLLPAVAYVGLLGVHTVPIDRHLLVPSVTPRRDLLIALLDRTTRPGDFVVCDDPMVALGAHRLLPPGLEDPSMVRTSAGYLTAAEAEDTTLRYHAAAIVASRPMFVDYLPTYLAWARQRYRQVPSSVPGAQVYLRQYAVGRTQ
jgi:hypothetical protein